MAEAWWKTAVVYQVYPRSFADSDGDGIGDLPGVLARLDHLAELGVDVIWLSPVYPTPWDDGGYDISDYQDIDPTFGSLADFDRLLAAVHERGMKLIMDLVVNHTSDEHPWFAASRSSRDDPKRDWYWWRPPQHGLAPGAPGAEPTNWQSFFSGPAWELEEKTGEYYLHLFSRRQPDLNWENAEVRRAVHAMMRWWLDRGVDGFRMDVINMISKAPGLPDGAALPGQPAGQGAEHFIGGPRLHEFLREMHREVFAPYGDRLLTVGEMPGVTVEDARLFTDPRRDELDMVFQFEHVGLDQGASKWDLKPLDLRELKASLGRWQAGLADVGWNSLYWNNHDQPRVVSRFGDDGEHRVVSAKTLATVLHLHHGTPYVYQGEELGMTNGPFAGIEDFRDIESLNYYAAATAAGAPPDSVLAALRAKGRDNARTPMQWDASPQAGFTAGEPWLPVNPNFVSVNAEAARADPDSVFHHYRRLIELRHTEPAVAYGRFTMLLPDDERVYAFTRAHQGVELLVVANLSGVESTVDIAGWESAELVLGTHGTAGTGPLAPWESRLLRSTHRLNAPVEASPPPPARSIAAPDHTTPPTAARPTAAPDPGALPTAAPDLARCRPRRRRLREGWGRGSAGGCSWWWACRGREDDGGAGAGVAVGRGAAVPARVDGGPRGDLFDEGFRARLERRLTVHAASLLRLGGRVVVEFGSWSRAELDALLALGHAAGAAVELHVLDPPVDELWRRLAHRNLRPGEPVIDRPALDSYLPHRHPPTPAELATYDPPLP